ncbi:hypothetical protein D3C80_1572670 [compost metagenome]
MQLLSLMLSVTVNLYSNIIAIAMSITVPGLHRAPDTKISRECNDSSSACFCNLFCTILRAVINNEYMSSRAIGSHIVNHMTDAVLFVIGWNYNQYFCRYLALLQGFSRYHLILV